MGLIVAARRELLQLAHRCGFGRRVGCLLVRLLALRVAIPATRAGAPQEHAVEIYTFVTDEGEYEQMVSSFRAAGFGECATFTRLSDASTDPFAAITRVGAVGTHPYAILCHQDVRLDRGAGSRELFERLDELERLDQDWVVAGCAGVNGRLEVVRRVIDIYGADSDHVTPASVMSLDEIVLILNRRNTPACTPGVTGFHLYGADVCLNALVRGGSAYVIELPVTHQGLGGAKPGYRAAYDEVRRQFVRAWAPRFALAYIGTTVEVIALSRYRVLEWVFSRSRVVMWVGSQQTARMASHPKLDLSSDRASPTMRREPAIQLDRDQATSAGLRRETSDGI